MFEHLDDPEPYAPPPELRTAVRARVRRHRQRRAAVVGGLASVVALGVTSLVAVRDRLEPQRVEVRGLADEPDEPGVAAGADPREPGEPLTILVVGVDRDHDASDGEPRPPTDTIALVRLDPEAGELRLLTIPRDLAFASLPAPGRINGALPAGGPSLLVTTITEELGIPVDHYVEVGFAGAVELVDAVGGIRVAVDRPVDFTAVGLRLDAGCQPLDGQQALALGRARTAEVQQDDGGWADDPTGALGREQRGSAVAAALLQAAGRVGLDDLPALVDTGLGSITVDSGLERDDLVGWARAARDDRVVPLGLPVTPATIGGADVLHLDEGASAVVTAFLEGADEPVPAVVGGEPVLEATGLHPC